jgi:demethylmenaquinone methyltransferase/2-methoxy-6-polyprenyl-1,4-benzoquinol methylase
VSTRAQGQEVFSGIARRYDRLNRILSLGREQAWRRSGIDRLPPGRLLDLGAGTGAAVPVFGDRQVIAVDPVSEMLALNPVAARVVAVGEALPFADGSFDGVFSAYVFRNLTSIGETLAEINRVLRPGGKAAVIGLGRPKGKLAAGLHRVGTAILLPLAGATVGARREYTYLHRSLDKLPAPEELFAGGALQIEGIWRMGPLGFVYGALLAKR